MTYDASQLADWKRQHTIDKGIAERAAIKRGIFELGPASPYKYRAYHGKQSANFNTKSAANKWLKRILSA